MNAGSAGEEGLTRVGIEDRHGIGGKLKFFKTLKFPKLGKLHKGFKWQQIYQKVADILVCKGNRGGATQVKGGKN